MQTWPDSGSLELLWGQPLVLEWPGMGWAGLSWAGLGWATLGWAVSLKTGKLSVVDNHAAAMTYDRWQLLIGTGDLGT